MPEIKTIPSESIHVRFFCPTTLETTQVDGLTSLGIHAQITRGWSYFRPLEGAIPTVGSIGEITKVEEARVDFIMPQNMLDQVANTISRSHTFDTFALEIEDATHTVPDTNEGRIEVLVPESQLQEVMDRLVQLQIGIIGNYDYCFFISSKDGAYQIETICTYSEGLSAKAILEHESKGIKTQMVGLKEMRLLSGKRASS